MEEEIKQMIREIHAFLIKKPVENKIVNDKAIRDAMQ